jgi:glycine betaine/choline ABC-type transport system substrate-binding protein
MTRRKLILNGTSAGIALTALGGAVRAFAQDGDKPTITVGSKNFTEQLLLSEIVALMLEDAGYPVERQFGLGGTAIITEAILNGDIDIFVEYTGTGLIAVLGEELPKVEASPAAGATPAASLPDRVFQRVKEGYKEQFDLIWLEDWGFNNTYAMAVTQETADKHNLKTTSDLEAVAGDMKLGTDLEFPVREDGLIGFEKAYGFGFGDVQSGDPGLMYSAVANGDVDVITAYTTDGRIPSLGLVILEDDREFFPPYYTSPVIRADVLNENPEIADILNQLSDQITEEEMSELNYQVDEEGKEPGEAARPFLDDQGFIGTDN